MKKIIGLVLIGLAALLLILNRTWADSVSINLLVGTVHAAKSIVILASIALGVAIGNLLK